MTKHTVITILGVAVVVIALGGFPSLVHKTLLVVSGTTIAVLSYLSSVVYCSNCKKLIEDAEQTFSEEEKHDDVVTPPKIQ